MRNAILYFTRFIAVICLVAAAAQSRAASQYTLLHGFAGAPGDGANPLYSSLATDGTFLYGVTQNGGTTNKGTVFKINVNGSGYQVLHNFKGLNIADIILHNPGDPNDGEYPNGTPCLLGGILYGTALYGGTNGQGVIYKINTDGMGFALVHSFGTGTNDGALPYCSLVTDGSVLYGMSSSSTAPNSEGAIFSIDPSGSDFHLLHNFTPATTDGALPQGSLLLAGGVLYGMTLHGGFLGSGTVFQISTSGSGFQLLHSFTGTVTDGSSPYGSLISSGSTLYGMTSTGGSNGVGTVFSMDMSGGNFKILHNFSNTDTWAPYGDVTLSGSTLYGMARNSGFSLLGVGTIFQVNTDGSGFQIPYVFSFGGTKLSDGSTPVGSLLLLGSQLYGMTQLGGSSHDAGALFSFNPAGSGGGGGGPVTALRVTIQPSTAVKAGAQWQVNGGAFFNSGALASGLTAGAHVVSYKAVTGFIAPAPQIIDITAGVTNVITGTYGVADTTKPTLKVITPTSKTVATSNLFTATGTASDNVGLALVYYQLNGGAWTAASSGNSFVNWTAPNLNLTPGPNVIRFYAKDLSGNLSATNSVTFTYTVSVPIAVNINIPGSGTVSPNLNGAVQVIGKVLSMSAKAAKGYAFVNWSGATNTSSAKISFVMASNLVFNANFKDITRPVNVILTPTKGQVLSSVPPIATGRASDNVGVTAVWYKVNSGAWTQANFSGGMNWQTADLSAQLSGGANTISAYALDAAGNISLTNTIAFSYVLPPSTDWAPDSFNGLLASVSPNGGAQSLVGFDVAPFAQTSLSNDGNPDDYGAGAYTYVKTDTNMAQLSLAFSAPPPGASNSIGPITLVFTNHYAGYFTNGDGDTGGITLQTATPFIPASIVGKTISAVSGQNSSKTTKIKFSTATTFTKTPANNSGSGSSPGTYVFTRFSPICGVISATFTSAADNGQTAYLQLTFTSAKGGTYFVMVFDNLGALQDVDVGTFTM